MNKARLRLVAMVLVAFSLLVASCFQIRIIALIGEKALSAGATTTFKIDLYRQSDTNDATAYVVLLVGLQDLDFVSFSAFDQMGNFGGPYAAMSHTALRDYLLADDHCAANGISATDVDAASFDEWIAFRTPVEVDSSMGGFSQRFRQKLNVKREAGTDDASFGSIVVFAAAWNDDGDGVVESPSDSYVCTSMYMSGVPFKP